MKYTVVTITEDGYHVRNIIDATRIFRDEGFTVFEKDKHFIKLADDFIISIGTTGYEFEPEPPKQSSFKQAKILQLMRTKK